MSIQEMLDQLAEYQAQQAAIDLRKQELVDAILTAEIKAKLAEIDAEFSPQVEAVAANIAALTDNIKAEVITTGASVKGAHLQAVYTKGRVSWDTKMLDGLAIVFPKLEEARKIGDPSVSIRKVA